MLTNYLLVEKSEHYLSYTVIVVAFFLICYSIFKSNFNYFSAGLFLLLCSLLYLKNRNHKITENDIPPLSRRVEKGLDLIFVIFYLIGIITIYFHPVLHERPLIFFIVFFGMLCLVLIQILFNNKSHIKILAYIIFLALFNILSQALLFNTLMSIDSFEHMFLTNGIVNTGALPQITMSGYSYLFHILHAEVEIISGLDYYYSNLLSVLPAMMICTVFTIFLVGKKLVTPQVGLFASFYLICSTSFLFFTINLVPNSYSSIFFIMALLLLLTGERIDSYVLNTLLLAFFIIMITVTHALFNIALIIVLIVFLFFTRQKSADTSKKESLSFHLVTFSIIIMFVWWIYTLHFFSLAFDFLLSGLNYSEYRMSMISDQFITINTIILPLVESFHLNMTNFILWIMGVPGCLYLMKRGNENIRGYAFSFVGLTLIGLLSLLIVNGRSIINTRYYYLFSFVFCVFSAIFLILIFQSSKNKVVKILTVIITLSICIICLIHPFVNITNPIYNKPIGPQIYPSESELSMVSLLRSYNAKSLASDATLGYIERCSGRADITVITGELKTLKVWYASGHTIIIRDSIFKIGYSNDIIYPEKKHMLFSFDKNRFSKNFDVGISRSYIYS